MLGRIFIAFILFYSSILSQENSSTITGLVQNQLSGDPISGASVYLSGTTIGTTTDKKGFFEIRNVKSGNYTLVASMIGYETELQQVMKTFGKTLSANFQLAEKPIEMKEISVEAEFPEEWFENLKIFKTKFLGDSYFAEECVIENEKKINLEIRNNVLYAGINEPLKIVNSSLGYKVNCSLLNFSHNLLTSTTIYFVSTLFEEMKPEDEDQAEEWKENRAEAYKGSLRHFLNSLINNTLEQNRFKVYQDSSHIFFHPYLKYPITDVNDLIERDTTNNSSRIKFEKIYFVYKSGYWSSKQLSRITSKSKYILLDAAGNPNKVLPFHIEFYLATRGVADYLPEDYRLPVED